MTTISIEEAQAKLPELIGGLAKGEELVITEGERVVARIVGERAEPGKRRVAGFAKGMMAIAADDDDHLKDFAELGGGRVAPAVPVPPGELEPRRAGSAKDKILWISPDFDAPLEEFREYME